jgi:hypothetical protein
MSGRFFEACDCYVPCPCWFDQGPDEDERTGVVAWQIENGEIDGVDVTGLSVVSVSQHDGHRGWRIGCGLYCSSTRARRRTRVTCWAVPSPAS